MSPRRWRSPSAWTLRARLIAALVALTAMISLAVGTASVIALDRNLRAQLEQSLDGVQERAFSSPRTGPSSVQSATPPQSQTSSQGQNGDQSGTPGTPSASPSQNGSPNQSPPGQGPGTLIVRTDSTTGLRSGAVVGENAYDTTLSATQLAALAEVPADRHAHVVDVEGLGPYLVRVTDDKTGIVGLSLAPTRHTVTQLAIDVTVVGLVGVGLAALAALAIVRLALRPLRRVAATATRVAHLPLERGEVALHERVSSRDSDPRTEVGQVGEAINQMLGHIDGALAVRTASEARMRRFVGDASHELRTPLASIRGYAELTRRRAAELPPEVGHAISRVEAEAMRMTGLVEDLLLLARLDESNEAAAIRQEPVDLTAIVVDCVSDAHLLGADHTWQLDLPEEPVSVIGDAARLRQVLTNLLANARVHTPAGTTVRVRLGRDDQGQVVLDVEDDGPGIPADLVPEVFNRFARADSSRSRAAGSTGLGLSIVASVVQAHEGTVTVSSVPGHTLFRVTLSSH